MHLQKVLTYEGHSESLTVLHEGGRLEKQFCQGFRLLPLTSLPNNRILYRSKYKALADNKINGTQELKFVFGWVEKILGKGENASSPFPKMSFFKAFLFKSR